MVLPLYYSQKIFERMMKMSVTLNYGVNSIETSTFSGKSVCDAAKFALEFLGAPKDATIKVNGQEVYDASILLEDGDVVEFVKVSGEKGI